MSDYGRYLILYISRGAEPRNKLYYCDLTALEGGKIGGKRCFKEGEGRGGSSNLIVCHFLCCRNSSYEEVDR